MSRFNNHRFTPGNKGNLRLSMNRAFLKEYYGNFSTDDNTISDGILSGCVPPRANALKQGFNDPSQPNNMRISQILTSSLGGRITYGNVNTPLLFDSLGGREGQPGGTPRPLRNKF
jgi:hypothetical protein